MQVVVDLGLQKTGSKARQRFFTEELHRVADGRALYPVSGRHLSWHRPLYDALASGDRSVLDALARELLERSGEVTIAILSYEEMYKLAGGRIAWLQQTLPGLRVVVFLRRQDQLVNSLHNQFHKSHRVPLRQLEAFERTMLEYDTAYDHRATLERWTGVLGRSSVVPILFAKGTSAVESFFDHAGISVNLSGYEETYPNRAMDAEGLATLRWIKQLVTDDELPAVMTMAHQALGSHFVKDDGTAYTLAVDDRRRILEHYDASNEWVRKEFFPERASLFDALEEGVGLQPDAAAGRAVAEAIVAQARTATIDGRTCG